MPGRGQAEGEMLKGTLDMMILGILVAGDAHGHTIAKVIERTSEDVLEVEQGSLYGNLPSPLFGRNTENATLQALSFGPVRQNSSLLQRRNE